jgi:hypothetical protein
VEGVVAGGECAGTEVSSSLQEVLARREERSKVLVQALCIGGSKTGRAEESRGEPLDRGVPGTHRGGGRLEVVTGVREVVGSGGGEDDALPGGA